MSYLQSVLGPVWGAQLHSNRRWEAAIQLLAEMPGAAIDPDTHLMESTVFRGLLGCTDHSVGAFLSQGVMSYGAAITACANSRMWQHGLSLLLGPHRVLPSRIHDSRAVDCLNSTQLLAGAGT